MEEKDEIVKLKHNIRIHHNELGTADLYNLVDIIVESLEQNRLEKDACFNIVKKLKSEAKFDDIGWLIRTRRMAMFYWKVSCSIIEL